MGVLRFFLKAAALPAFVVVAICKWIALFLSSMTGWIFRTLALITFLTAAVTYLMQISDGRETIWMLIGAFAVFMLPIVLDMCTGAFTILQTILGDFLRS